MTDWNIDSATGEVVLVKLKRGEDATLALKKDAFDHQLLDLAIETDAHSIELSNGDILIPIARAADGKKTVRVQIDRTAARPKLLIDKVERPELKGKCVELVNGSSSNINLAFKGTTYVNLSVVLSSADAAEAGTGIVKNSAAVRGAPAANNNVNGNNAGNPRPAGMDGSAVAAAASHAVLQVVVKDEQDAAFASGSGFLISPDGFAITNFHVVQGASAAVAHSLDDPQELAVQLWSVDPRHDLALIKVDLPKTHLARPLTLSMQLPMAGSDVWALGFPMGLGFSVNKGVVNGVRTVAELPPGLRDVLSKYAPDSHWLQTDCTINHGNSGGPLIDASGKVVGINTWSWTRGNNIYFALSSVEALAFVDQKPSAALGFAAAIKQYGSEQTPWSAMPGNLPYFPVKATANTPDMITATRAVTSGLTHKCVKCGGSGSISERVKVGSHKDGAFVVPDYETRTRKCLDCGGTGVVHLTPEATERVLESFVKTLAASIPSDKDPSMPEAFRKAYTALESCFTTDRVALLSVTQTAKEWLAEPTAIARGLPLLGCGQVIAIEQGETVDETNVVIELFSNGRRVILSRNKICDPTFDFQAVFFGGLVAGSTRTHDGQAAVVLENGFVVDYAADLREIAKHLH